jgi:hypothetical protein
MRTCNCRDHGFFKCTFEEKMFISLSTLSLDIFYKIAQMQDCLPNFFIIESLTKQHCCSRVVLPMSVEEVRPQAPS